MTFDPIFSWPFVIAVGAILFGLCWWTYRPRDSRRWVLLALRAMGVAIALGAMLRPSLVYTKQQGLSSTLVLLVDKSRSMLLRDAANDQSRWQAVQNDVEAARSVLDDLSDHVQIRWFEFGKASSESSQEAILSTPADQDVTALGDAMTQIQRQMSMLRPAGILLLTDGANNTGASPLSVARQLRTQRIPIHAFGYGREVVSERTRDLAARAIRTSPTVFAKNRMTVLGEFDVAGFSGQPVRVRLMVDGVEEASGEFRTPEEARRLLAELQAVPIRAGDVKVTLEATVAGDEQLANNSISTWITVLSGGVSVLAIEGKYRYWEPKFLRWALDQSPDIELTQLFVLEQGANSGTIPPEIFEPGKFDVIILGDIAARQFTPQQLARLADLVEKKGVGLMMMGGYDAFGPGGWGNSPVADLLPVTVGPADQQRREPLNLMPTEVGLRHYILRLASSPEESLAAWQSLRPLDGSSTWSQLKPAAQLLARSPDGVPLLAAQTVGAGRSLAFAGDTTWRWRKDKSSVAYHARFWRQLVLWLAQKDEAGDAKLKLSVPIRRVGVGQPLAFSIRAEQPDGAALGDAVIQATLILPDGTSRRIELFREGDEFKGTIYETEQDGDYTLQASGMADGEDLGTQSLKFLVFSEDLEMQQPAADLSTLETIAKMTDGSFHGEGQLADFLRSLKPEDLNLEISQPIVTNLWDRWEVLLLFLLLVAAEWVLRKRWGYV